MRSIEPGISRFRVRLFEAPRNDGDRALHAQLESCRLSIMEWTDEGIVLGVRRHGESSAIVELLTRSHGRHLGLVRGGASSRMRPLLQPGNSVSAVWRARPAEHPRYYSGAGTPLRAAP